MTIEQIVPFEYISSTIPMWVICLQVLENAYNNLLT